MRVLSVIGNRPQFVKAAPLVRALRRQVDEVLVHTGQHYDPELADLFFDELDIPAPDHALEIGRRHAERAARAHPAAARPAPGA